MKHILSCSVFREADFPDCTNKGITAQYGRVIVITDVPYKTTEFNGETYFDCPDEQAVQEYVHRQGLDPKTVLILCDKTNNPIYTPYLKPLDSVWGVGLVGPCFGGNYVRLSYNEHTLIRVHDRYDTEEDWDGLSR